MEKRKRKWGDRFDGYWVKDVPGLQTIMAHLMPNRTDCEVYMNQAFDVTELLEYVKKKNEEHPEYRTSLFHCIIFAVAKMVYERPKMNRFIQGRRMYERYDISAAFVAKRRFADDAEESLMFFVPKETDTMDDLSKKIYGDVNEMRKSEVSTGGIDKWLDRFAMIPRVLLMFVIKVIRWLDFWGKVPRTLTDGDPNYSSIFLTNLGSIRCPEIYHHLNNYGTNSMMISIGTLRKEEKVMPDGSRQMRDMVNLGVTLDERIGDGFYFARSLKLVQHIFRHPEILDQPMGEPSGFDYNAK
ncbi:MAG: 2-oxo acid dehydrogenase subunit E2 [Erysipelotrichales bacterium]|nr:2-oxo acid dehydrogenase subunit E2 [Erysipelotrichales bacterium]MBQ1386056.1 2-oxo acid dehydrogenase subunit E2 [Erysipelotrichales bacterium]MBQ2309488.1 2-oxo acid dehydrogenase subunit E2 [Erysipelotrichales bacterium]MBQ2478550.1 2-oxo acid dehydrogenase subunit E2 [Erysipelotrichales bacterium]MBQ5542130.1 2-oxo acid dehydrogenase subunit E2 [Erysipelotrichales bacterium]